MLRIEDLTFRYSPETDFLWSPFSFTVGEGEIVLVKGKNGSGKTTLLHTLCGIIPLMVNGELRGEVSFRGKRLAELSLKEIAPQINILFQEPDKQIFMPTVEEEIAFGPENLWIDREEINRRLTGLLARFQITHLRQRPTSELSFGQKKLVVLAGILAMSPRIILIDEFSAGIEEGMIETFCGYIRDLQQEGRSFILAEHHPAFTELAGRIIDLDQDISDTRKPEQAKTRGG